jgi:hypothetical protein
MALAARRNEQVILRTPIFQLTFSKLSLPKSTPSNTI